MKTQSKPTGKFFFLLFLPLKWIWERKENEQVSNPKKLEANINAKEVFFHLIPWSRKMRKHFSFPFFIIIFISSTSTAVQTIYIFRCNLFILIRLLVAVALSTLCVCKNISIRALILCMCKFFCVFDVDWAKHLELSTAAILTSQIFSGTMKFS